MSIDISSNTDEHMAGSGTTPDNIGLNIKPTRYIIHIVEGWEIHLSNDPPNWFRRKMMNLLFGWEFEIHEE